MMIETVNRILGSRFIHHLIIGIRRPLITLIIVMASWLYTDMLISLTVGIAGERLIFTIEYIKNRRKIIIKRPAPPPPKKHSSAPESKSTIVKSTGR